jgi:hypothetical protein
MKAFDEALEETVSNPKEMVYGSTPHFLYRLELFGKKNGLPWVKADIFIQRNERREEDGSTTHQDHF